MNKTIKFKSKKYGMNITAHLGEYNIMFEIGIIITILLLIYDIIAYFFFKDNSGIIIGFQENINEFKYILLFILSIILEFSWNLGIWLTIYYLTPCHFIISESISEYIYYTFDYYFFKDEKENDYYIYDIILYSFCYIINIFSSLIFNEIIILNFFGLDYYTKKRIQERGREDTKNISFTTKKSTDSISSLNSQESNEKQNEQFLSSLMSLDEADNNCKD